MEYLDLGFLGLFLVCFLSATILPFSSELVLGTFLYFNYDPFYCLLIATLGNTLGGLTNYVIGYMGKTSWLLKTGITELQLMKLETRIDKYGVWLAFFSWLPFIGDPLVIGLGYFKVHFFKVLVLMTTGKFLRYLILIYFFY